MPDPKPYATRKGRRQLPAFVFINFRHFLLKSAKLRIESKFPSRRYRQSRDSLPQTAYYSRSKLWFLNFKLRQFSETVRTTLSGTPPGTRAWISTVTRTSLFGRLARCWMTSFAIVPMSRLMRAASTLTLPKNCVGGAAAGVDPTPGTVVPGVGAPLALSPLDPSGPAPVGCCDGFGRSISSCASAFELFTKRPTASEPKARTCPPRRPR